MCQIPKFDSITIDLLSFTVHERDEKYPTSVPVWVYILVAIRCKSNYSYCWLLLLPKIKDQVIWCPKSSKAVSPNIAWGKKKCMSPKTSKVKSQTTWRESFQIPTITIETECKSCKSHRSTIPMVNYQMMSKQSWNKPQIMTSPPMIAIMYIKQKKIKLIIHTSFSNADTKF